MLIETGVISGFVLGVVSTKAASGYWMIPAIIAIIILGSYANIKDHPKV